MFPNMTNRVNIHVELRLWITLQLVKNLQNNQNNLKRKENIFHTQSRGDEPVVRPVLTGVA